MANRFRIAVFLMLPLATPMELSAQGYLRGGSWEVEHTVSTYVPASYPFGATDGDVVGVGDIDGDQVPDFVVTSRLGVALFSGAKDTSIWMKIFEQDFGVGGGAWPTVTRIHDWNGNGYPDVLIADHDSTESPNIPGFRSGGAVYVISTLTGDMLWSGFGSEFQAGKFGVDATAVPDQNGDGVPDLAVAAEFYYVTNSSAVVFLSGVDGSFIRDRILIYPNTSLVGLEFLEGLDADQDGMDDLLISTTLPNAPQVMSTISGDLLYMILDPVYMRNREYGDAVVLPDLNGDGIAEFVMHAGDAGGTVYANGAITLRSGSDGTEIWTVEGKKWQENLGVRIVRIPDWDADGLDDLAVSAPDATVGAWQYAGMIRLVSGRDGSFMGRILGGEENSDVHSLSTSMDIGPHTDGMLIAFEKGNLNGLPDGRVRYFRFEPYLITETTAVSASAGASFDLHIDLPDRFADKIYALLLSRSGYGPTVINGVNVPLSTDSLLWLTRSGKPLPFFDQPYGRLDLLGDALIQVNLPPGALSSAVGGKFYAAVVVGERITGVEASSVAVTIEIQP
jgi:hypothetical protein